MSEGVKLLIGTKKGIFIFDGDDARRNWRQRGPSLPGITINHVIGDPATGLLHAAGGNRWTGLGVWTSADDGETWALSSEGFSYGEGEPPVASIWSVGAGKGVLYAGAEPAGLFRSTDAGKTWTHVEGLRNHPSRPHWVPGGAGLILHSMVIDPTDNDRLWVAISTAGVFHSADGGKSWEPRNKGTRGDFFPGQERYPEFGQCVHCLTLAPGGRDRLYQQNHLGMYRSDDGGTSWHDIGTGLPSDFGFPAAAHPRDPDTLFLAPLNSAEGGRFMPEAKAAIWKTRDAGATWSGERAGLPQENAFFCVWRQAMAVDAHEPCGVYFGSNSGALYASPDEGESWSKIAENLPSITSVETVGAG
jgi:photosystem II stability/assembly factor-like uncharacterized protein